MGGHPTHVHHHQRECPDRHDGGGRHCRRHLRVSKSHGWRVQWYPYAASLTLLASYPHAFGGDTGDGHRLVFPGADPRCNTQTRSLFEFPVLLNNRPFNRNSRTDPPGPARAIYISPAPPALIVCGVVTHVFPSNPRNPFRLCYPIF